VPSTENTLLLKEQSKNGFCAAGKAILIWVTLHGRGGRVVHLVRYGGDYTL
jgi:hypothetical protein